MPLLLGDRVAMCAVRRGTSARNSAQRVVVVGARDRAAAFVAWTALNVAKRGASVTLIDAWGTGTSERAPGARRVLSAGRTTGSA